MRLIDVDELGVGRCSKDVLPAAYCAGWNGLLGLIEKAPTVDAVPVVRCKDCRYRGLICCPTMHETMGSGLLDCAVDDGYCWCGKPKEGTHADNYD